jgi:hypothetical protein
MKRFLGRAVLGVLFSAAALAGQQQAPTLGQAQPSPNRPPKATTINRRRLMRIQAIYFERIDNNLSLKLAAAFSKMGWARIVDQPDKADAIVRGTCFDSRRLKELHSEVYINDRASGASIWQDVVRVRVYPPALAKAVAETATQVAGDLKESLQAPER